jgi:hypothetical protein
MALTLRYLDGMADPVSGGISRGQDFGFQLPPQVRMDSPTLQTLQEPILRTALGLLQGGQTPTWGVPVSGQHAPVPRNSTSATSRGASLIPRVPGCSSGAGVPSARSLATS